LEPTSRACGKSRSRHAGLDAASLDGKRCDCWRRATSPWPAGDGARPGSVLVLFGAAEHDWAALELAAWFARSNGERFG
jgi:hypothetical protein